MGLESQEFEFGLDGASPRIFVGLLYVQTDQVFIGCTNPKGLFHGNKLGQRRTETAFIAL